MTNWLQPWPSAKITRVRIDKWLWAARFFKTRALAARACEVGRIVSSGQGVKASRELRAGDLLRVKNESGDFEVEVLALSEVRGPAPVAQTLYRNRGEPGVTAEARGRSQSHAARGIVPRRQAIEAQSP